MAFNEADIDLQERVQRGQHMAIWMETQWPYLREQVVNQLIQDAFETYQRIAAEETNRIIESQMIPKTIHRIEDRMKAIIQDGMVAASQLSTLAEDEHGNS